MASTTSHRSPGRRQLRAVVLTASAIGVTGLLVAGFVATSAQATTTDLACGRPATASSNSASAAHAVDCAAGTAWQSSAARPQQLQVDLGSSVAVDHVTVTWGAGYATSYKVRTAPDGASWHTVAQRKAGHGGTETVALPAGTHTRWVQLYLSRYAGSAGFAIGEFGVYGEAAPGPTPTGSPTPTATASPSPSPSPDPPPTGGGGRTVPVSTADQLTAALAGARPGDTIKLAAGQYSGAFFATTSGTATHPVTLTGPATAVLSSPGILSCDPNVPSSPAGLMYCGYGLHLNRVSYWRLTGFTVANSPKGIILDGSSHNVLDGVTVHDTGDEGVHFRAGSADNVIQNSTVHDTGRNQPGFGEGLYFGSAKSNWVKYGENGTGPDHSDRNQALNNHIGPNVAAESVDIKEGTVGGVVRGNTLDGRGMQGANFADALIDVKGSGYTISGNHGSYSGGSVLTDGNQVHQIVAPYGCANVFQGNDLNLGGASGYGFNVTDQSRCRTDPNVVYASNTVTGAAKGLTNVPVTAGG